MRLLPPQLDLSITRKTSALWREVMSKYTSSSAEEFADIFVLVDNSLQKLNQFKNELNRMISQLDVGPSSYRIGLALYGRDVRVEFRLNAHKTIKQYEKAVKNFRTRPPLGSNSDLAKALEYAAANFFTTGNGGRANQGARQFLVVALQQDFSERVFELANTLRSEGVTIVAMSETVPKERMRRFADPGFEFENLKITELKNTFTTQQEEKIERDSTRFSSADIVFVICESDGIGSSNFHLIRTFVKSIIGSLIVHQKKDRVAIITYSDRPTVHAHLNSFQDRTEALESINRLRFQGGGTRTGAALRLALDSVFTLDKGSRKGVQKFAVVITDGGSQDSVREAAVALQRAGVRVFAIGPKVNSAELYDLASYPSIRHVFEIDGFTKLKALTNIMQKSLFHSILQSSTNSFKNSQDVIEACAQKDEAGIFFLIDDSDSITERDLADTKNFIAGFIKTFRIKLNNIRIGLVKYSNSQTLEFYLSKKSSDSDVNKLLEKVTHQGGGRRTGGALDSIDSRFQLITSGVPTYLILVTAGQSDDDVREPARKLGEQGVTVFAVGLKDSNKAELQEISGDSERSFYIRDYYLLKQIKDNILRPICGSAVCKDSPSDVIFLTESSDRISAEDFRKMKEFMKSVINKSIVGPDGVHVGVMQFSTNPELVFSLKSSKDEILRSIDGMNQLYGGVQTGRALSEVSRYFAASQGGRPSLMQNLVLITFSEAVDEIRGPAKALREKGVVIFSIDAQDGSYSQLTEISGPPDRVVNEVKVDLIQELDSMLALKFCDPQRDCKKVERADIIFLVDGSESIADRFGSMQIFMESIVNQTIVSEDSTRFGAILYSSTPEVQFRLNQYASSTEVRQAIYSMVTPNASTYTGLALEYSLQFFEEMNGGRRNLRVPQILMVITDGVAYDKEKLKVNSDALRANGVSVMSIGVKGAEMDQLLTIAGNDESLVFYVDTFEKLETLYTNMTEVICNQTKNDCDELDLVFLLDRSGSINTTQHKIMKDFTGDLVENLQIGEKTVHVGLAQFSENFQDEFYLNRYYDKQDIANHIRQVRYLGGSTYLGKALNSVKDYFSPSRGSRDTVPKTLVVFSDGNSYDDVEDVSNEIRNRKIADDVIAIAIGDYYDTELLQITGDPRKIFKVGNIENLPSFKKRVSEAICSDEVLPPPVIPTLPPVPLVENCTIDVAIVFDISQAPNVPLLRIVSPLQEIVRSISIVNDLSNLPPIETKISFSIMSPDGSYLLDTNFEAFNPEVLMKTSTFSWSQATYFNSALLSGFNAKFRSESRAAVKVLIIFSDGLDEDVMRLKRESERLKTSGVSALLVVALDSAQAFQLLMVEFGRAHNYKAPLKIGLQSISSVILQELSAIAERICCNVFCRCYGTPGPPGLPGTPGDKGAPGEKGHPGYPGEEGSPGRRGPPGLPGPQGIQGCPGHRGQKGSHSFSGSKGEDGENGLDGINGEQGETGEDGMKGEKGDTGGAGIPGTRGEKGLKGQRGLRGDPGEPGRNNNRPGTKGEPGNQGEP
ncbi:collagen alpha-6(VI) chain-like, partial [Cyprinodon tularosa]|uniref:collagen alpha-6(VI) chain-like n=1 Tax=Cyprinodon tularosa TaxID=77115 RepID=UPI0018E248C0